MTKAQGCIRRDPTLTVDDSRDAVHRDVDLARQLSRGKVEFRKLLGEMLARMDWSACDSSPSSGGPAARQI
jgi:hypothetical protein